MHEGLLFYDNSQISLLAKIQKAADYYQKKYGHKPNLVLINPSMYEGAAPDGLRFESDDLTIRAYRPVLPNHLWIGIEDGTNIADNKIERGLE